MIINNGEEIDVLPSSKGGSTRAVNATKSNTIEHKRPKSQYEMRRTTLDNDIVLQDFDQDE